MKRESILQLPPGVLAELRKRIFEANFSCFHGHSAWLNAQGFAISKSALHRYAQTYKSSIKASAICGPHGAIQLKLECLELAAMLSQADEPSKAMAVADELLLWVLAC